MIMFQCIPLLFIISVSLGNPVPGNENNDSKAFELQNNEHNKLDSAKANYRLTMERLDKLISVFEKVIILKLSDLSEEQIFEALEEINVETLELGINKEYNDLLLTAAQEAYYKSESGGEEEVLTNYKKLVEQLKDLKESFKIIENSSNDEDFHRKLETITKVDEAKGTKKASIVDIIKVVTGKDNLDILFSSSTAQPNTDPIIEE